MNRLEQSQCMAFMYQLEINYPKIYSLIFHVPNEAKRTFKTALDLKKMGMKAGVPDYILPVARCGYHSLMLELKTETGKITEYQRLYLKAAARHDNFCAVTYGIEQAIDCVLAYWHEHPSLLEKYEIRS